MPVKLKGFDKARKGINKSVKATLQTEGKAILDQYFTELLQKQEDALDKPLPKKAESTKRIYVRKGWNVEQWLIRTGESTQLKFKNTKTGLHIEPLGKAILKMVPEAGNWFALNKRVEEDLLDVIKKNLNKELK